MTDKPNDSEAKIDSDGSSKMFVLPSLPDWASEDPENPSGLLNPEGPTATPSHKTATTSLKEFCDKSKLNPKFDLISSAGGKFVYEAKLDSVVFTAEAASKKTARHKCSEMMLLALKDQMSDEDKIRYLKPYFNEDQVGEIQKSVAETFVDKNPIGELQEYAVALQWPAPDYDLIDETGPAHVKSFVMQCTLNKLVSVGNFFSILRENSLKAFILVFDYRNGEIKAFGETRSRVEHVNSAGKN